MSRKERKRLAIMVGIQRQELTQVQARYADFGPTLLAERLAEEGLMVDHETLWRLLAARSQTNPTVFCVWPRRWPTNPALLMSAFGATDGVLPSMRR